MDTRFLTTFIEVVKTRHFGKAAENLYLTQSAVSARIKQLEEYFHTTLFIRHRNSIQLTPAGEKLLPYAESLCATLKQAKNALQVQSAEYVVCGSTQLISEFSVPDVLHDLHAQFPEWSVKAEIMSLDQLSRQLHERTVDVAFSHEPLKSEEFVSLRYHQQPLGLYRVNSTSEAVNALEFVAIDWGSKARDVLLAHYPVCRDAKLRTNSLRLAMTTLQRDGGYAVLPQSVNWAMWGIQHVELIETLPNVNATVYINYMKSIRRVGLESIIDHMASMCRATQNT